MSAQVIQGDCLEVMKGMADASVDLIVTDPPYFKVKADWWDHQWEKPAAFLEWLDTVLAEFQRILKPNGSLYVFASPQMAARVEMQMAERFNILNHLIWDKGNAAGAEKGAAAGSTRSYVSQTERLLFAEPAGVFAKYLRDFRQRHALTRAAVDIACSPSATSTGLCYRWEHPYAHGGCDPTRHQFEQLHEAIGCPDGGSIYDALRRTFAPPKGEHTDVLAFPAVQAYEGKHVCEKPISLLQHIIQTSSRPGAVVFDAFSGSGSTGEAAVRLGRQFIGAEIDPSWAKRANRRIANAQPALLGVM